MSAANAHPRRTAERSLADVMRLIADANAALGYPAFRARDRGPIVPVQVLRASTLPDAWPRLDAFEGPEYQGMLVPVWWPDRAHERRLPTVANLYAAGPPM